MDVVSDRSGWRSGGGGCLHLLYVEKTRAIVDAQSAGGIDYTGRRSHAKAQRRKERLSLALLCAFAWKFSAIVLTVIGIALLLAGAFN